MIKIHSTIAILFFCLSSFAMEERLPDWLNELFIKKDRKYPPSKIKSMGIEADEVIDLIAKTYIEAGGDTDCIIGGGEQAVVELLIIGNPYCFQALPLLAQDLFKERTKEEIGDLTLADMMLFVAFTCKLGEEPLKHQFYYLVNKMKRENTSKILPYYERLDLALKKLPETKQVPTLYRFINSSLLPRDPQLGDLWDLSLSSGSSIELTHFKGEGKKCIKFIMEGIKHTDGRDISSCSALKQEQEFMFFNNTQFVIVDIQYDITFNVRQEPQTMMIIRLYKKN